jgi:hypothetical protein
MALEDDLEGPLEGPDGPCRKSGDRNFMVTPPELGIECLSLALRPSPQRQLEKRFQS